MMFDVDSTWYSVELTKQYADIFKDYLTKACIYYEPSEAGHLIHFECRMTKEQHEFANDFLRKTINTQKIPEGSVVVMGSLFYI